MVVSDPWLNVPWKVYASQGADGGYLKPDGKSGSFTLDAVIDPDSGQTAYYTVSFDEGDMPTCWKSLLLYPLGNAATAPPSPLLSPWTPSGDAPWLAAANAVRAGLSVGTSRLVGDLTPTGNTKSLTLVCVPSATTSGTPLLVAKLVSPTQPGQAVPLDTPTGGAHGDN